MAGPRTTLKTRDAFLHLPPPTTTTTLGSGEPVTVVFFVTGNPGLIGYYHEFLEALCRPPEETSGAGDTARGRLDRCVVAGFSLGGFELEDPVSSTGSDGEGEESSGAREGLLLVQHPPGWKRKEVYGLRDQVELCYARVCAVVELVGSGGGGGGVNVVLMGHSVGAYIALEVVRMHHRGHCDRQTATPRRAVFDITASVLLTPTILDIARSASGQVATPLLTYVPLLPEVTQLATRSLAAVLPRAQLRWLVRRVTGMKDESGGALDVTTDFLGRSGCVKQALHLARDEMMEIGADGWGEEIWGVVTEQGREEQDDTEGKWKAPKLWFWFAKQDHWVADVTREEIVGIVKERYGEEERKGARREGRFSRPEILIDEDEGLVHAWCIQQSVMVATRVRAWLEELLESSSRAREVTSV